MKKKTYSYMGESMVVGQLAEVAGMSVNAMRERLKKYDVKTAVEKEKKGLCSRKYIVYEYQGEKKTVEELAEIAGVNWYTLEKRLVSLGVSEAVEKPKHSRKGKK